MRFRSVILAIIFILFSAKCPSDILEEKLVPGILSSKELTRAENILIRKLQAEEFKTEIADLSKGGEVSDKSPLVTLCPFIDSDQGLLRTGGRLKLSTNLNYDEKHPIILLRKHAVTQVIIDEKHRMNNHAAGVNYLHSQVARKFWCPGLREACREAIDKCNYCKRSRAKPIHPLMASLPKDRLGEENRAFAFTSVDMAGPYMTKQGRGRVRAKRWLCIFTCCSTRAVHIELSYGIDTDSFLRCNTRFINRRGCPQKYRSDQGTNFVGAKKEIDMGASHIQDYLAQRRIEWVLNCPAAPHHGGIHESIVKSVKRALPKCLDTNVMTDEELTTVLTNVEGFLNARPLTYTSSDASDLLPLTPSHFLTMFPVAPLIPGLDPDEKPPHKESWKRVQEQSNEIWKRFLREYLPTLNARTKWYHKTKALKAGDVVIVLNDQTPRAQWPLGRIVEMYTGKDDTKRVAKVRVGDKSYTRPVVKLIPLFA